MKTAVTILLVLALYGCIAASTILYGRNAGALAVFALLILGILEGIV